MIFSPPRHRQATPKLISNTVSNADEISRWVLDRSGIQYRDERHAPGLHVLACNLALRTFRGIANNPVYMSTDALTHGKDGVFRHLEQLCEPRFRLLPDDDERRRDAVELYHYFWDHLWRPVGRFVYSHLLPHRRETLGIVTQNVPGWEKNIFRLLYPVMARIIADGLELAKYSQEGLLSEIRAVCDRVEARLDSGQLYLTGDTLTIADLFFAVTIAPLVLPPQFRGAIARSVLELPESLRPYVGEFSRRPAGVFALRVFRDHRDHCSDAGGIDGGGPGRPERPGTTPLPREPGTLARMSQIARAFIQPPIARLVQSAAQKWLPAVRVGGAVFINRHRPVIDILSRDEEFTIAEINGDKMENLLVPFFLGMDRSEQHDRELELMRSMFRPGDLDRIRQQIRTQTQSRLAAQREIGRVDVPATITRPVVTQLIADFFGVPGPTRAEMQRWLHHCFRDLFLNNSNNQAVHQIALASAQSLKEHLDILITAGKRALRRGESLPDTMFNRLLQAQVQGSRPWLDDDTVRRNISGVIIGALATTSAAVVLALDELLRRPQALAKAREAAVRDDMDMVHGHVYEALRFNQHNPVLLRHVPAGATVDLGEPEGPPKPYQIPAQSTVYVGVGPAMFDPRAFAQPGEFNAARTNDYLLFGHGYHRCYGRYINAVTIPEFVAAILRLDNVRRAPALLGRRGLYDGPFPSAFVVEFDS